MYLLLYLWYIELEYCLIFLMLYGYLFIYSLLKELVVWILDFEYILLLLLLLNVKLNV